VRIISDGRLTIVRGEGKSAPIYVDVASLRALGYDPPDGEPTVEELVTRQVNARLAEVLADNKALHRENDELHQRVCAVERLHACRPYSNHCLPPGYEPWI
jgi:hypothetical protein